MVMQQNFVETDAGGYNSIEFEIPSLDDVKPGMRYNFPRVFDMGEYQNWYEGNFSSLRTTATIANGLLQIPNQKDILHFNFFKIAADYYVDAVLGDPPTPEKDFFTMRELKKAVRYWAIKDLAVMMAYTDKTGKIKYEAVDPINYFRVGRLEQPDDEVDHLLLYPYPDNPEIGIGFGESFPPINRIKVVKIPRDGESYVQHYKFTQNGVIGEEVDGPESDPNGPSTISGIIAAGDADSYFRDMSRLAWALMIRLTNNGAAIYKRQNYPIVLPESVDLNEPGDDTEKGDFNREVNPVIFARAMDNFTINYPVPDIEAAAAMEHTDQLFRAMGMVAGISPTGFGWNVGKNESGVAREKTQDRGQHRVLEIREELSHKLYTLEGFGPIGWQTNPFEDREAKVAEIEKLINLKVIAPEEARERLGYPGPVPTSVIMNESDDEDSREERTP